MDSSDSDRNPVEELAEEFVARWRRGERPALSEYTDRYPQWADRIRKLFPALVVMEKVRPDPEIDPGYHGERGPAEIALERLGDYRILREVGRGGMGIVYEAEQESLGRHVALKVLPAQALLDPRHLQRFKREARAVARLHHTNIVPVHGVGEQDGLHYFVMQLIHGQGLDEVLVELKRLRQGQQSAVPSPPAAEPPAPAEAVARSLLHPDIPPTEVGRPAEAPLPEGQTDSGSRTGIHLPGQTEGSSLSETGWQYWYSVTRIGIQVADALAYAASQGVLHRDIKPSNLLLDTHGTVWVTDFGLAKAETDQDNVTHTGDVVGTLRYMAPERFSGKADIRSDVYALGLTLYELITLRAAFDETDRNKLITQVMHDTPPRPRQIEPAVPRDLETIVLKAIAHEAGQRYQTPGELADDLRCFLDDRPIKARRQNVVQRGWRWCRRNPALAALVAVLLVGFTVVAWLWWRAEDRQAAAQRERLAAARQRDRAQNHYERAFGVVDRMLTRVGERELANVPLLNETRLRLLEDALAFYTGFLRDEGDDPAVRREIGRAHGRIARIQHMLGRLDRAEQTWGRAIELQQELIAEFPNEPAYQVDLAISRRGVAVLQHLTGRRPAAEQTLRQLLDDQARLASDYPDLIAARGQQMEGHFQLGVIYHETRRYDLAEAAYQKALGLGKTLSQDEPANLDHQEAQTRCLNKLGVLCRETRRLIDAEKYYRAALDLLDKLVSAQPQTLAYQASLASIQGNLASLLTARGRRSEAETAYRRALGMHRRLAENNPDIPDYRMNLARTSNNFGLFYSLGNDHVRAEEMNRTALKLHEELMRRYPERLECAVNFAGSCGNQALYLNEQGKVREALPWYGKTIDALTGVLAVERNHTYAHRALHNTHHGRAGALLKLKQPEEAAKDWQRMVELGEGERHGDYILYRPRALAYLGRHARATSEVETVISQGHLDSSAFKEFASVYSLCCAAVRRDRALSSAEIDRLAEGYAVRAIALLAKAGEKGYFRTAKEVAAVRKQEKFQPLVMREDFRKVLVELEQKLKTAPK
jgi:serine/threonine protein kinase